MGDNNMAGKARHPIPTIRSRLPGETAIRLLRDRLGFLTRAHATHGDLVAFALGRERVVLASHPEAIRSILIAPQGAFKKGVGLERAARLLGNGLLTSEGATHLRQRRLVQPAFHRERLAHYAGQMQRETVTLVDTWPHAIDAHAAMHALALRIAGTTFFGADVGGATAEIGAAVTDALRAFEWSLTPLFPILDRLTFLPMVRDFHAAQATLDRVIAQLIAARRRETAPRDDLLGMLLAARDAEGDGTGMSERQLRDEILTLLVAGHETTANLLTFALWRLATLPDLQAQVRAEVDRVLGSRDATMDDLPSLPLTRAVVSECLRLHPPAWIMGRRALRDHAIGPHVIRAGTTILASPWIVHRDPRWWPDADAFQPARWLTPVERQRFAFFPFGGGLRLCVGEQFAWMEAMLVVATIVQRMTLAADDVTPPATQASITLRPVGAVPLRVAPRPRHH